MDNTTKIIRSLERIADRLERIAEALENLRAVPFTCTEDEDEHNA